MGWPEMEACRCMSPQTSLASVPSSGSPVSSAVDGHSVPKKWDRLTLLTPGNWSPRKSLAGCLINIQLSVLPGRRSNLGRSPSTPLVVESPCVMDFPTGAPNFTAVAARPARANLATTRAPCSMREVDTSHPLASLGEWPVSHIASKPLDHGRDNLCLLSPSNLITPSATKGQAPRASPLSAVEVHCRAPNLGIPAMHGILLVTLPGPVCLLDPCLGLPPKPVRLHWTSSNVGVCGFMAACQQVQSRQLGNNPSTVTVLPHPKS